MNTIFTNKPVDFYDISPEHDSPDNIKVVLMDNGSVEIRLTHETENDDEYMYQDILLNAEMFCALSRHMSQMATTSEKLYHDKYGLKIRDAFKGA